MKPCYVLFTLLMILQNVAGRQKRMYGGCPAKPGEAPWLVFIRNCDTEEKYKTEQEMISRFLSSILIPTRCI